MELYCTHTHALRQFQPFVHNKSNSCSVQFIGDWTRYSMGKCETMSSGKNKDAIPKWAKQNQMNTIDWQNAAPPAEYDDAELITLSSFWQQSGQESFTLFEWSSSELLRSGHLVFTILMAIRRFLRSIFRFVWFVFGCDFWH